MSAPTAAGLTVVLLVWVAGCGGDGPPAPRPVEAGLRLVAEPETVPIQPSQSRDVVYRLLTDTGQPVPERVIQFSIIDNPATPGDDAGGATLSSDRGVTNSDGVVGLQIIAGPQPTMFRVRAAASRAPDLEVLVLVTTATHAPLELAPVLIDPPVTGQELTTVRLYILDGESCAQVSPRFDNLPTEALLVRTIPSDTTALFSAVKTEERHHVVAVGLDGAGTARAGGCADVPGSLLLVAVPLRVVIPMHLFPVAAEGSYDVVSRLPLRPAVRSTTLAIDAWRDLGSCPMDPARLWLDCTLDALKSGDGNPSDCRPTDDEGPLGPKLLPRRGAPVGTPGVGLCRDRLDAVGRTSHDALAVALFPAQRPRILEELPALATELSRLLDAVELRSTLTIGRTSSRDRYRLSHRLVSASFPQPPTGTIVELLELGAPVLEASFVPGTADQNDLAVGTHGFTLRLGSAARLAFGRSSLVPRGVPANPGAFVNALFASASRNESGTILGGCAALDAVLCADVAEPRGCLMAACTEGLLALRRRLDAGFQAMDGDDVDFVLGGTVALIDADGDGQADALGRASNLGLWSGEVRGRGGANLLTGTWTAAKTGP